MEPVLLTVAALALGLLLGGVLGARAAESRVAPRLQELERAAADARARAEEREKAIALQRSTAEDLRRELSESFGALAGAALQGNAEHLLTVAAAKFAPFDEQLKQLKRATEELEGKRERAYGTLQEQLHALRLSTGELKTQSERLATALRGSAQARGRWGETTLRRLVELAGMQEHCDFDEQLALADGQRPDLVVRLPGAGCIPVDAKVPLAAYLDAAASADEDVRRSRLTQHATDLKSHVRELARRDYARSAGGAVDFTVLFVPGEPFLAAAFAEDPELFEWALEQRILIASPVTLLALLRTVRLNWDHVAVERNAQEIREVALRLFDSVRVFGEHFEKIGASLGRSVEAYNSAAGSLERNVLPKGRRLAELRVGGEARELPSAAPIEKAVRSPAPRERDAEA
jgi:DNA recombination protein RmuC